MWRASWTASRFTTIIWMNNVNNRQFFYPVLVCALVVAGLLGCQGQQNLSPAAYTTQVWQVNSVQSIAGAPTQVLGSPVVVDTALLGNIMSKAVRFSGDQQRLLVDANPLGDAEEFTIEVVFRPDEAFAFSPEPRFVHIEAEDNPNRRITIELRLNEHNEWYLDAYIKSELSQHTLIDATKVHPIGPWYHAAITYRDRQFASYVNGVKELQGDVDYLPIAAHAKTSLGARMNRVHWFKGDIAALAITPAQLQPAQFFLLDSIRP